MTFNHQSPNPFTPEVLKDFGHLRRIAKLKFYELADTVPPADDRDRGGDN